MSKSLFFQLSLNTPSQISWFQQLLKLLPPLLSQPFESAADHGLLSPIIYSSHPPFIRHHLLQKYFFSSFFRRALWEPWGDHYLLRCPVGPVPHSLSGFVRNHKAGICGRHKQAEMKKKLKIIKILYIRMWSLNRKYPIQLRMENQ